jgi:hypothetical protein
VDNSRLPLWIWQTGFRHADTRFLILHTLAGAPSFRVAPGHATHPVIVARLASWFPGHQAATRTSAVRPNQLRLLTIDRATASSSLSCIRPIGLAIHGALTLDGRLLAIPPSVWAFGFERTRTRSPLATVSPILSVVWMGKLRLQSTG